MAGQKTVGFPVSGSAGRGYESIRVTLQRFAGQPASPELSRAAEIARFTMPDGGGWRFGRLTGDYNGIHYWPWYARRFGFRTAFLHSQRVAGMCMARLRGPESDGQSLQLWIKGPPYYGANVLLNSATNDQGVEFTLCLNGDRRAALLGRWQGTSIE